MMRRYPYGTLWYWAGGGIAGLILLFLSENTRTFASILTETHLPQLHALVTKIDREQIDRSMDLAQRESMLLASIENGNSRMAQAFLAAGVSPNTTDSRGWTPLMLSAIHNQPILVAILCASGANPNAQNAQGTTALMLAANKGHEDILRLLLAYGAKVDNRAKDGWTALMYAAWNGHAAIIPLLLTHRADATVKDNFGWTALMYASWNGHLAAVKALLPAENVKSSMLHGEIQKARRLAAGHGHVAIVQLFDQTLG
ncbi:MAG: ankyrin repeat domain-containing protein [Candidatus Binatia bacterium]